MGKIKTIQRHEVMSFLTGKKQRKEISLSKRQFFAVLIGIGAVLVILASIFIAGYQKTARDTNEAKSITTLLDSADALTADKKTDEAKAAYESLISKTETPERKVTLYLNEIGVFLSEKDYDGALVCAKKAEAILPNDIRVVRSLAHIYLMKNDKTMAIEYYKKAIDSTDKKSVMAGSDIKEYQDIIKSLGGSI
jgi:tetratricopeptide (TPR) repeat protein